MHAHALNSTLHHASSQRTNRLINVHGRCYVNSSECHKLCQSNAQPSASVAEILKLKVFPDPIVLIPVSTVSRCISSLFQRHQNLSCLTYLTHLSQFLIFIPDKREAFPFFPYMPSWTGNSSREQCDLTYFFQQN